MNLRIALRPRSRALALTALGLGLFSRPALAQGDVATAQALFEQGRQLLRAGNAAAACPKLSESFRIDPSTGTLLALAMCHEADGKLASAWAEFTSVEARARNEGRADREQAARARAQALKPRLSTLEVRVPTEVAAQPGLQIKRDGAELGPGGWNVVVPVDPGEHWVEVSAPGKASWRTSIAVKPERDAAVIAVPALRAAPKSEQRPGKPDERWNALQWTGVGMGGAGVVGLGIGSYFLATALGKKSQSSKDCDGDLCGPDGAAARRSAVSKGNTATIFGIAGGALAVAGGALFYIGQRRGKHDEVKPSASLWIGAGPTGMGARYSASF